MPFRAAELYYSLVGRDIEHDHVPFALDAGVGIMAWSPLAGGFLSGKYPRAGAADGGGGRLTGFDIIPFDRDKGYAVVDCLRMIASTHGVTPAQIAIAWLLHRPGVASVLIGATRIEQLDENLGAVDVTLTPAELTALDEMTDPGLPYPLWHNVRTDDAPIRDVLSRSP
jgi:aryl-alcohol dehydrogenase-like predicted oxidoreductase